MNTKKILSIALPLTLPVLATACGDAESASQDDLRSDRIDVTSLELSSEGAIYLNHPVRVTVAGTTSGTAYETDLLVGMRTLDGAAGCVLGSMPAQHDAEGETVAFEQKAEFVLHNECFQLAGRDDVEMFTSFDPWNKLGDRDAIVPGVSEDSPLASGEGMELFHIVAASALSAEGCESCETVYSVNDNPGYDAQLESLGLDTVVAVVGVTNEEGETPELGEAPHFSISADSRVTGLDQGQGLADGLLRLNHRIRPLGSSEDGLPLTRLEDRLDGVPTAREVSVESYGLVSNTDSLYIEGQALEAIAEGSWADVEEFEVVSCLEADFDQAIYGADGELEPRANDCGAIPVVVVRQTVEAAEALAAEQLAGAAKSNGADVWEQSWTSASKWGGFANSGMTFKTWLENSSTDFPTTTEGGIEVYSAGSWFEAGVDSYATVFGQNVNLVDIYGTFIAYDWGGGGVAMGAQIFVTEIIPEFELQIADGQLVSLNDMLSLAGVETDLGLSKKWMLAGIGFDDGCGSVTAGVWVESTLGINGDETGITPYVTPRGVKVEGTFQPYFNIAAKGGVEVNYGGWLWGSLIATLNLLDLQVPFNAGVEFQNFDVLNAQRIVFNQDAGAQITTLSGDISFSIGYKFGWPLCWKPKGCTGEHNHTIAEWAGLSSYAPFFTATQALNFGDHMPSSSTWCNNNETLHEGDFNGDGHQDWMCHGTNNGGRWLDYNNGSNGFGGTEYTASSWCSNGSLFLTGDFNGDGRDDTLCDNGSAKVIDYADANGQFQGTDWSISSGWCHHDGASIIVDDFNADGKDDLLCRDRDGKRWLDYADQNGQFGGTDWHGANGVQLPFRRTKLRTPGNVYVLNTVGGLGQTSDKQANILTNPDQAEWVFEEYAGYYRIRNAGDGTYLHTETGALQANNSIWNSAHSNHWSLVKVGNASATTYRVRNRHTGKYLRRDGYGGTEVSSNADGGTLWDLDGSFFR
ncbi:putative secreted esterase [Plesiocystis pacifica SIR-1]|uniref:Putative secreted esterase n=1 Tax=Plesiocystis pacifica SIR-1 TaxID=391625 RepID=A6G3R8_9BACT|nr:FG-GAP-like repeat-containing protein [Plesiocystis pacifica]EDM79455.1 putative secreted esterase [Plesiocystis pacifica SIR-1]